MTKFSEAQIAFVLKQADYGTSVGEVCVISGNGLTNLPKKINRMDD